MKLATDDDSHHGGEGPPPKHVLKSAAEILYDSGLNFAATQLCIPPAPSKTPDKAYEEYTYRNVIPEKTNTPKQLIKSSMYTEDGDLVGFTYCEINSESTLVKTDVFANTNGEWAVQATRRAAGWT